jgi:glycerol kinase
MAILSIDQGTSGTKAIVVDESGTVLSLAEIPVHPKYVQGGGVEQDPRELLDSVLAAGRRAVEAAGAPIEAVALANQGETVLAWDPATGEPLTQAIVWQDSRSQEICDELADSAELVAARTGLVLDPYFSAPKMAWLRRHWSTDGVVTTTDAWLVHALTGECAGDVTTASRSLLLDLDSVGWDEELLCLFGLQDEPLPRLVSCDEIVGTTSAFGGDVPLTGLIVDQQSALLAEGCTDVGSAKCTFGTGAFLLVNTGESAPRSANGLTTSVAWRTREGTSYCLDGQVYTAASAVRWMMEIGLVSSPPEMDVVASADAEGVLFVPALAGLAAPWWRSDATASFTGLSLASTRGHLVRAVLEGVAAHVADLVSVMTADVGRTVTSLRVDGGLTNSRVLMQAQADLLQVPVEVYPSAHATPLGAASLARFALTSGGTLADSLWPWTPDEVYVPTWSADRAADFLHRWRAAAEANLPVKGTP